MYHRGPGGVREAQLARDRSLTGVRYITDDLIRKVSKKNILDSVTSLNLALSKEGGKKIKFIENLEKCKKLTVLNLSCNVIEKIEKLDKLTRLRELNLSYNNLSKLENIDMLTNLQVLNITGNSIENIPIWVGKKLKVLRVFKIAKNQIKSLHELSKLRPLKDLTTLTCAENPVTQIPHYRHYSVFYLRTLSTLDGQAIEWQERQQANERFSQDAIEELEQQLEQRDNEIRQLQEAHDRSQHEVNEQSINAQVNLERLAENEEQIRELTRELNTKNDLLKRKTYELTNACEKHYTLEQELAFYKIDHKFEKLGKLPTPENGMSLDDEGLIGESPYIGRGRFKQNEYSRGQRSPASRPRSPSGSGSGSYMDSETRERMHAALDDELEEKRLAITQAQDRLRNLQDELLHTEEQMIRASDELQKLQSDPRRSLTEDDKQQIRSRLTKKKNRVHHLQGEVEKIHQEMDHVQNEVHQQEKNIGKLKAILRRTSSKDSIYNSVQKEVADKEVQLEMSNQQYQALQQELQNMFATIAREAEEIRKLEQELREGQAAQNDEIKEELQSIINNMQSYLADVQDRADKQKQDYNALLREREELLHHMNDIETENQKLALKDGELSRLHQRLAEIEDSLEEQRDMNKSLRVQLDETRLRETEDAELSGQLHDAEEQLNQLRREMRDQDKRAQTDKEHYETRLKEAERRAQGLSDKAKDLSNLENEIHNLHQQLNNLHSANTDLQDQLYREKQKAKDQKKEAVNPDELRRRLDDVIRGIRTGKGGVETRGTDDHVGHALGNLQDKIQHELNRSHHDLDRARRAHAKAEAEIDALKDQLALSERKERVKAEQAVQAQLEDETQEMEKLKRELDLLRAELEREREASKERPIPTHLLEPTTQGPRSVTSGATSSSEESTVPSSQWSQRKAQMYEDMTPEEQDLFDELQSEIEELRKLLGMRDRDAAGKAKQAENTAAKLRDMISGRRRQGSEKGTQLRGSDRESRSERRPASTQASRARGDPRLAQAADDLARAQDEINMLHDELKHKDRQVREEARQADRSQHTIVAQQEEMDRLTNILEEQKEEITRLVDQMERITAGTQDAHAGYDEDLQRLRQGAADVRSSVAAHRPGIQNFGAHSYYPSTAPAGREPVLTDRHTPHMARDPYNARTVDYVDNPSPGGPPLSHPHDNHQQSDPYHHGYPHHVNGYQGNQPVDPGYTPSGAHVSSVGGPVVAPPHAVPVPSAGVSAAGGAAVRPGAGPALYQPSYQAPQVAPPQQTGPAINLGGQVAAPSGGAGYYQGRPVPSFGGYPQGGGAVPQGGAGDGGFSQVPPGGGGVMYAPAGTVPVVAPQVQAPVPSMHSTPIRPSQGVFADQSGMSQPTTPIAGSLMGHHIVSMPGTPNPIMVSTPNVSPGKGLKGILKNAAGGGDLEEEMLCNVPEHHDLEDYIAKLQAKLKKLKAKLKDQSQRDASEEESRRVLFEDDVERQAIKRLRVELEDRRAELEGLDLAIERQKSSLSQMRETEKVLLAERQTAHQELQSLRQDCKPKNRKAFLAEDRSDYDMVESDYDYEYNPRSHISRRDYLTEEVACLEETLAKRRAELRHADQLLTECEADLQDARKEAQRMMKQYKDAKSGYSQTMGDSDEIEKRAHDAGVELVKATEQVAALNEQISELKNMRAQQEEMLKDIDKVITAKDTEFHTIDNKVKDATQRLCEVEGNLYQTESQQMEKLTQAQENTKVVQDRRKDLESLNDQLDLGRQELELLDRELGKGKAELQLLQDTIQKRHSQLDALDREVEAEINNRRREIKEVEIQIDSLRKEKRKAEDDLDEQEERLRKEEHETKRLQSENAQKLRELESLKERIEETNDELGALRNQQHTLEDAAEGIRKEKATMDDLHKAIEKRVNQLKRTQSQTEDSVRSTQLRQAKLEREVKDVESELESARKEKSSLQQEMLTIRAQIHDGRSEVERVHNELEDAEGHMTMMQQLDAERRQHTEEKFENLEHRVQELAHEIEERNEEKEQLAAALNRSCEELQNLRTSVSEEREDMSKRIRQLETEVTALRQELQDRATELTSYREKSAAEIADLEGIAQAHYSRANRLSDELNYLRADYLDVKRQLQSQQEVEERERKLEETLHDLKADIKNEVSEGISDLDKSRQEAMGELEQLHDQKDHLEYKLDNLKHNLSVIRHGSVEPSNHMTDQFALQQDLLKRQLLAKMTQHAEVMQSQRQTSQDNIRKLQQKLSNLEQVLSKSETAHLDPLNDHLSDSTQYKSITLTRAQPRERSPPRKLSPTRAKRAYSPNRHSQQRSRHPSDSDIPEKGPTS